MTYTDFTRRCWAVFDMAGGSDPATRGLGWGVPEWGYYGFLQAYMRPMIERGVRRFLLHRPYGDTARWDGTPMNFDARPDSYSSSYLWDDLSAVLRILNAEHPDVVVMLYLGSMWEPDLKGLLARGKPSAWLHRVHASLLDALNAPNVDIGFDHSATYTLEYETDSPVGVGAAPGTYAANWAVVEVADRLKHLQGRRVWIEGPPKRDQSRMHDFPVIAYGTKAWWRTRPTDDPLRPRDANWTDAEDMAPSTMLGNVLRVDTAIGRGGDWTLSMDGPLSEGHEWGGALVYAMTGTSDPAAWNGVTMDTLYRSWRARHEDDGA